MATVAVTVAGAVAVASPGDDTVTSPSPNKPRARGGRCLIRQDLQACHESKNQSMALKIHAFERAARALDTRVGVRFSRPDSVTAEE